MLAVARSLVRDAARSYSRHSGRMLANAVAFSSLLSIAPLLFIALGLAGIAVGDEAGQASVHDDLARWIGEDSARTILGMLAGARAHHATSLLTSVLGAIVLVYASTRLFSTMRSALNHMWDIHAGSGTGWKNKIWKQVRIRGSAVLLVVFVGVLIIAVVIAKTVLVVAAHGLGGAGSIVLLRGGEMIVSLVTTTLMFGTLFKVLPDARLAWRDAWRGGLVTSVLFAVGTTIISLYLGHRSFADRYGPAASLVVLLLWVQYSAQVFFLGAAVTGELAKRRGAPIVPDEDGQRIVLHDDTSTRIG